MMRHAPKLSSKSDVIAIMNQHCETRNIGVEDRIISSWQRSLVDHGLDPSVHQKVEVLSAEEMREELQRHEEYLSFARQGVSGLSKRISVAGFAVVLTDEYGLTLDTILPEQHKEKYQESGLYVGAIWAEKQHGTNGIGTCLIDEEPLIVHQHEHFLTKNIELSCSCTPIFDPQGKLKGCLNASFLGAPKNKGSQLLTLQMVQMYGRMIENSYFRRSYRNRITMSIRSVKHYSDLFQQQMIAVNEKGVIIGANRSAFKAFSGLIRPGRPFLGGLIENIVDLDIEQLLTRSEGGQITIKTSCPSVHEEIEIELQVPHHKLKSRFTAATNTIALHSKSKHPTLDQLAGQDGSAQLQVDQLRKVIDKDIPILITGETGTGKEAFARAIHDSSARAPAPFIALNCAAIPESLIESELFGYLSGTFTGASKKGMKGKLELANGGTLFLDEIGDMPIQLQTRLLRVLAERETLPLGATQPIPIEIQVISATHQDLQQLIKDKLFREDFYYRLNGMVLTLPALRYRADKNEIIDHILSGLSQLDETHLNDDVRAILCEYNWPGNIRQLISVLKYALALADGGSVDISCLPSEILGGLNLHEIQGSEQDNGLATAAISKYVENQEEMHLLEILKKHRWNITQVAKELNICRSTVYRKMEKFNVVQPNEMY